jgi:hypothetical protein
LTLAKVYRLQIHISGVNWISLLISNLFLQCFRIVYFISFVSFGSIINASHNFSLEPLWKLVKLDVFLLCLDVQGVNWIIDTSEELIHNLLNEKVRLAYYNTNCRHFEKFVFLIWVVYLDFVAEICRALSLGNLQGLIIKELQ